MPVRLPLLLCVALAGCDLQDMYNQPAYRPLQESDSFGNGMSASPAVPGTIPRGGLRPDEAFFTGKVKDVLVDRLPIPLDRRLLERGRQRFDIYCSVCHGRTGRGDGMIVQRGFKTPPPYYIARLREAPIGHFFHVITHGHKDMPGYAKQIEPRDRWAISAYIRALQLSQGATLDDVPAVQRAKLQEAPP